MEGKRLTVQKDAEGILRVKESINDIVVSDDGDDGKDDDDGEDYFEFECLLFKLLTNKIAKNYHRIF